MENSKKIKTIQLPFVMKAKLQNKLVAALILPVILLVFVVIILVCVNSLPSFNTWKDAWDLIFLLIFILPIVLFLSIWPVLSITKITCENQSLVFSTCFITHSRINWDKITRIETKTRYFWFPYFRARLKFTSINIFHKKAFLGLAIGVSTKNYSKDDLAVFRRILHEKTGLDDSGEQFVEERNYKISF